MSCWNAFTQFLNTGVYDETVPSLTKGTPLCIVINSWEEYFFFNDQIFSEVL